MKVILERRRSLLVPGVVYVITVQEYVSVLRILKQVTAWVQWVLEVNVGSQLVQSLHARVKFLAVAMAYVLVILLMCANAVMDGWAQTAPCVFVLPAPPGLALQLLPILHMICKNALILVYASVQKVNAFAVLVGMGLLVNTNHALDRQRVLAMGNV
jgi:hypothetical protein